MKHLYIKQAVENRIKTHGAESLGEPFHGLYRLIGYDGIEALCDELGGSQFYVPTLQRVFQQAIIQQVQQEFDGFNHRELSRRYGLSERTIRNYVKLRTR